MDDQLVPCREEHHGVAEPAFGGDSLGGHYLSPKRLGADRDELELVVTGVAVVFASEDVETLAIERERYLVL